MMLSFILFLFAILGASRALPSQEIHKSTPRSGTYGLDISNYVSSSGFACLKGQGYEFAIVRAYRSTGQPDPNAVANIKNARKGGIEFVDVYMFPCPKCSKSASEQVQEMVDNLGSTNFGGIWLDVEVRQYWLGSYSANQQFFEELLTAASGTGHMSGVYTSPSQWGDIMGRGYTGGSNHQLWYTHYDYNPTFSDFRPFGGWSSPDIKQYAANDIVCGVKIDKDWY